MLQGKNKQTIRVTDNIRWEIHVLLLNFILFEALLKFDLIVKRFFLKIITMYQHQLNNCGLQTKEKKTGFWCFSHISLHRRYSSWQPCSDVERVTIIIERCLANILAIRLTSWGQTFVKQGILIWFIWTCGTIGSYEAL